MLGRHVHVIHPRRLDIHKFAARAADDAIAEEVALVVNQRVRLRNDELFLAVGGEKFDFVQDAPVLGLAIGRFQKAELVDARERCQRRNQTDVRAFRRFNRANAAVVRRMHVADLEARAVAAQAARPQRTETALVRQLCQRIDLIHELAQL